MTLSFSAISLVTLLAMGNAFAADVDLATGNELEARFAPDELASAVDFNARSAVLNKLARSAQKFEDNLALVNQINADGNRAEAVISQSGGKGNLAIINQDTRTNSAVAMIFQSGSGARAVINQR